MSFVRESGKDLAQNIKNQRINSQIEIFNVNVNYNYNYNYIACIDFYK